MSLLVDNITFGYADRAILHNFSLAIPAGTTTAIIGPSGSGKSTLLRIIAGLEQPNHGKILVDQRDVSLVPTHLRSVGMVFQDNQLFPHLDVHDNVAFGLKMLRHSQRDIDKRCDELLELVGLSNSKKQSVTTLSGGEAKRIALARALAPSPKVLLLDEPLTGLDRDLHARLAEDLRGILHSTMTTALLVTHDLVEATVVADTIEHLR